SAQSQSLSLEEMTAKAEQISPDFIALEERELAEKVGLNTAFNIDKTEVFYNYFQNELAINGRPVGIYGVRQGIDFPGVYFAQKKKNKLSLASTQQLIEDRRISLKRKIAAAYYQWLYLSHYLDELKYIDSVYSDFSYAAQRKFELGESNYLEKITAQSQQKIIALELEKVNTELKNSLEALKNAVKAQEDFQPMLQPLPILKTKTNEVVSTENPFKQSLVKQEQAAQQEWKVEQNKWFPGLNASFFWGSNSTLNQSLEGYEFGLKIPLFYWGQQASVKKAKHQYALQQAMSTSLSADYDRGYQQLRLELAQLQQQLQYFESEGQQLSNAILDTAQKSYKNGAIDFFQYIQSLQNAWQIRREHLSLINTYNQVVLKLNFFSSDLIPNYNK
ncbi:MAG: TolC family protein, partial [Flavobacteriaceae bacterium]|nr:TolC family protein [Flavobacteriaceae bacterium]